MEKLFSTRDEETGTNEEYVSYSTSESTKSTKYISLAEVNTG